MRNLKTTGGRSFARGYSLFELLVTVLVSGVLAGVGVPSFRNITLNSQRSAVVNDFVAAMNLARAEVAKHDYAVVVCPDVGGTCAPTRSAWDGGWLVFVNRDNDEPPAIDADDVLLKHFPKAAQSIRVNANRDSFVFRAFGTRSVNGTARFCDERGSDYARTVIVAPSGKLRTSGKSASGQPIACP